MRHRGNNRIEKRDWILLRSLFASDQQDLRRCCRLIDQIDVGTVPLAFVQVFCKGQKVLFFLASRRVTAVHGDTYEPVWFQPGKAASYSPHGGTGRCCAAFVCAGQIAQVEYSGLDKGLYMIRKMLVGIADHFDGAVFQFFCKACFAKTLSCGVYGFLLDIECIELCRRKSCASRRVSYPLPQVASDHISFGDVPRTRYRANSVIFLIKFDIYGILPIRI